MAESFIEHVRLTLPHELCLMIYSFTFTVNFEVFDNAQAIRKCFQDRGLPPRAACLEEETYRTYRQNPEHRKIDAHWPDDLEKAFFDGIEHTYRYRPGGARFLVGIDADFARVLQSRGIFVPSRKPRGQNETIAYIIGALTGRYKSRKQVSSHMQVIKNCLGLPQSSRSPSGLISSITSLAAFKPFYMHDALYRLLHDGALNIGDDIRALETLSKALAPAFRQAIKNIGLSLDPDEVPRILMLLRPENYPGLELVSIEVWPYSDGSVEIPCVKSCYDAADHFKQSLLDINPKVSISYSKIFK